MIRPRPHRWRASSASALLLVALGVGDAWAVAAGPAGFRASASAAAARSGGLSLSARAPAGTSSYLGGTGTENVNAVAVDPAGNIYLTGFTESPDFPTVAPIQSALVVDPATDLRYDAFVAKVNPEGTALVWSTFLGGKGRDAGDAIAVGADGSVFVTGYTESEDFPLVKPFQGAYGGGPSDAFVAKIRPDGTGLEYSSYLGGRGTDGAKGLALDAGGSAYLTGSTGSPNFVSVNPLPGAASRADDVDAFVVKVIPDGAGVQFATRLGGTNDDHGSDVAVDGEGSAYVTGDTRSPGFPTVRPLQAAVGGTASGTGGNFSDAFVAKLSPSGSSMVYSTFLGGSESDQGAGIAVDATGSAYVTGSTRSTDFATASPVQGGNEGDVDAFVTKLNADGSALVYSTYLGGSAADGGAGLALTDGGDLVVTGSTGSSNLPTARPSQAANGGGLVDAFVTRFNPAGSVLLSSTYLGGSGDDQGSAVAVARSGEAHVAGYTDSPNLPAQGTGAPSLQPRLGGGVDGFVLVVREGSSGSGRGVVVPPAEKASSDHDRRVRLLTGITLVLFLLALIQTLYLRRRDGGGHGWRRRSGYDYEETPVLTEAVPVTPTPSRPSTDADSGTDARRGGDVDEPVAPETAPAPVAANPWLAGGQLSPPTSSPPAPSLPTPAGVGAGITGPAPGEDPGPPAPDMSFWDLFPDGPPAPPEETTSPPGAGIRSGSDDRLQNLLAGFPLTGSRPADLTPRPPTAPAGGAPSPVSAGPGQPADARPSWLSSLDDFARREPPPDLPTERPILRGPAAPPVPGPRTASDESPSPASSFPPAQGPGRGADVHGGNESDLDEDEDDGGERAENEAGDDDSARTDRRGRKGKKRRNRRSGRRKHPNPPG